jgi:hypothetical protein
MRQNIANVAALIAACHSKSCAPPPIGKGGSDKGPGGNSAAVLRNAFLGGGPALNVAKKVLESAAPKPKPLKPFEKASNAREMARRLVADVARRENNAALLQGQAPNTSAVLTAARVAGVGLIGLPYRLKGPTRTAEKIHDEARKRAKERGIKNVYPGKDTPESIALEKEVAAELKDLLRFTVKVSHDEYGRQGTAVIRELERQGVEIVEVKNSWKPSQQISADRPKTIYQGVNITARGRDGQLMEIQLHTGDSFTTKDVKMHKDYETTRSIDPSVTKNQRRIAYLRNARDSRTIPVPPTALGWTYPTTN